MVLSLLPMTSSCTRTLGNSAKIDRDEEHPLDVLKAVGGVLSEIGVLNEAEARAWLPKLPDEWHTIQEAIRPHFRSALTTRWAAAAGDVPEVDASLAASCLLYTSDAADE